MSVYPDIMIAVRTSSEVGAALRTARRARGWTQAELAEAAGLSRATVINVERGHPRGEIGVVLRILAALGWSATLTEGSPPTRSLLDDIIDNLRVNAEGPDRHESGHSGGAR